jgi:predicted molibdopterin-dependent oxidoreductase YjgC
MTADLRIPSRPRGRPVRLRVDGVTVTAYPGETVFAALVAAGVRILRRPHAGSGGPGRGGLCGMGVCQECRVTVDGLPDQRACMLEVRDGMEIVTDAP